MNMLTDAAETAVSAAVPGIGWARLALKFAPWLIIGLLAGDLAITRARLHAVRIADQLAEQARRADAAEQQAAWANDQANAAANYADRLAKREPIIIRSHDTVTQYAQTPAGRAPCLAGERVHGIDELDSQLAATAAASGSGALHDTKGTPPD
jgi:hypothetical protein